MSTQRKVYENVKSETLRNELLNCVTEVLFIRDSQNANLYHPRIDGQRTMQFANLTQSQQEAYNQLYNNFSTIVTMILGKRSNEETPGYNTSKSHVGMC